MKVQILKLLGASIFKLESNLNSLRFLLASASILDANTSIKGLKELSYIAIQRFHDYSIFIRDLEILICQFDHYTSNLTRSTFIKDLRTVVQVNIRRYIRKPLTILFYCPRN